MLTGTRNGQVIVWHIPSGQRVQTLNDNGQSAHRDRITDLKLSPDQHFFVTTSADCTAKVWDANTKDLISVLRGHTREVNYIEILCFSLSKEFIITSILDNLCMCINQSIGSNWFKRSNNMFMASSNRTSSINNASCYDTT